MRRSPPVPAGPAERGPGPRRPGAAARCPRPVGRMRTGCPRRECPTLPLFSIVPTSQYSILPGFHAGVFVQNEPNLSRRRGKSGFLAQPAERLSRKTNPICSAGQAKQISLSRRWRSFRAEQTQFGPAVKGGQVSSGAGVTQELMGTGTEKTNPISPVGGEAAGISLRCPPPVRGSKEL
jgi:hypothetical protein